MTKTVTYAVVYGVLWFIVVASVPEVRGFLHQWAMVTPSGDFLANLGRAVLQTLVVPLGLTALTLKLGF